MNGTSSLGRQWLKADLSVELRLGEAEAIEHLRSLQLKDDLLCRCIAVLQACKLPDSDVGLFIDDVPTNEEGAVCLSNLEGAGFYLSSPFGTTYHKGTGSVDCIMLRNAGMASRTPFARFGYEYSGTIGLFHNNILGVKVYRSLSAEFFNGLTILAEYLRLNPALSPESVSRRFPVPLVVAVIPAAQERMEQRLPTLDSAAAAVHNNEEQAILIGTAPSAQRGTDKRFIKGAWHETQNVFSRVFALGSSVRIGDGKENYYYCEDQSYVRGRSIRTMLSAGFGYISGSYHFQNVYVCPDKDGFGLTDFSDTVELSRLTYKERVLTIYNMLVGWRTGESLAQRVDAGAEISMQHQEVCVGKFLHGLNDEIVSPAATKLFSLLPFNMGLAVSELLTDRLGAFKLSRTSEDRRDHVRQMTYNARWQRKDLRTILSTQAENRHRGLVQCLGSVCLTGLNNPNGESALSVFVEELRNGRFPVCVFEWCVEHYWRTYNGSSESKLLNCLGNAAGALRSGSAYGLLFRDLHGAQLQQAADEVLHVMAPMVREMFVYKTEASEVSIFLNFLKSLSSSLAVIIDEDHKALEHYIEFVTKRPGLVEMMRSSEQNSRAFDYTQVSVLHNSPLCRRFVKVRSQVPDNELHAALSVFCQVIAEFYNKKNG